MDARAFINTKAQQLNVEIPPSIVEQLSKRTEGNAVMLNLSMSHLRAMDGDFTAMKRFVEGVSDETDFVAYIIEQVLSSLQANEQKVAAIISVFPEDVKTQDAEQLLDDEGITPVTPQLDVLQRKSIVSKTAEGYLHYHNMVREYCYSRGLDPQDRMRLHQWAAFYYEKERKYLAASHHHILCNGHQQATDILITRDDVIISTGKVGSLLVQLDKLDWSLMSPEQLVQRKQSYEKRIKSS